MKDYLTDVAAADLGRRFTDYSLTAEQSERRDLLRDARAIRSRSTSPPTANYRRRCPPARARTMITRSRAVISTTTISPNKRC